NSHGGAPDNAWIDVSLEMTAQTNLTLKVARQPILSGSINNTVLGHNNPIAPITGVPMLGYIDPNADQSGPSAYVYYSNMRVVELSPWIYKHATVVGNPTGSRLIYPDGAGDTVGIMVTQ